MSFVEGALVQIREVTTEACVGVLKTVVRTATVALVQQTLKLLSSEIKQDHRQRNRGNGRAVVWVGTAFEGHAFRLLGRGGEDEPQAALAKLADAVSSLERFCEHLNDVLGASPAWRRGTVNNMMTIFSGLQHEFFDDKTQDGKRNKKEAFERPGRYYFEHPGFFESFVSHHESKGGWSVRSLSHYICRLRVADQSDEQVTGDANEHDRASGEDPDNRYSRRLPRQTRGWPTRVK